MSITLTIGHNEQRGPDLFRTYDVDSEIEVLEHLAHEYVALRTATEIPIGQLLDGVTVVDTASIQSFLVKTTVAYSTGQGLDVVKSDFGEVLAYHLLEEEFKTTIPYKGQRHREVLDKAGRGIDIIGVEDTPGLTLLIGEVKTSDADGSPPDAVDELEDSLSNQLRHHATELKETVGAITDRARHVRDSIIRDEMLSIALWMDEGRLDKFRLVCCGVLVRPRAAYTEADFGLLHESPELVRPGHLRFLVACLPRKAGELVRRWDAQYLHETTAS